MRCLRCGSPRNRHVRANGGCIDAPCPGFVEKWPEEAKPEIAKSPAPSKPKDTIASEK